MKRQADVLPAQEDPEKQHKEWKVLHRHLARVAREAKMVKYISYSYFTGSHFDYLLSFFFFLSFFLSFHIHHIVVGAFMRHSLPIVANSSFDQYNVDHGVHRPFYHRPFIQSSSHPFVS